MITKVIYKKDVELPLLPVPRCKGLRIAQLVETSNVESPTLMYVYKTPLPIASLAGNEWRLYIIHLRGIHCCFVFD